MGLRCSILGHTFGETEVRRDRRERGENEVVTVVAQVERCSRCGTERVVSENKEVVSVVDAAEVDLDGHGAAGSGTDPSASTDRDVESGSEPDTGGTVPQGGDDESGAASSADAVTGTGTGTDAESGTDERTEPGHGADAGRELDPAADPSEEDVEFITETEGSLGGGDEVTEDVPTDVEGGIGGMAARSGAFGGDESSGADETEESAGEDAEILDAPESERAPGQWPDEPDTDDPWEPNTLEEEGEREEGGSRTDPEPEVEPVAEPSFTVPKGSLRCQNCGTEVSADSSFRAGDACPECQTGYLEASEET